MNKLFKLLFLTSLIYLSSCANANKQTTKEDVVREMIIIVSVAPNYPKGAADDKIEGEVVVQFTVTKEGVVKEPQVMSSTPEGIFEEEAIRAIMKYKFSPRTVNNEPIEALAKLTIEFKLSPDG